MPTKIIEFFSKGVPIVCNRFNHDIEEIVNDKMDICLILKV